jgi:HK97 family phage portal protein
MSVITAAAEAIGVGLNSQKFGKDFFGKGTLMAGYLSTDKSLNPEVRKNIGASWSDNYSGQKNQFKTGVLDEGFKYNRMSIAPNEAQFIETRKFSIEDIARFFGVPPHKIAHLEKSSFNNIEQQNLEFVIDTLRPLATKIEQEYNRKIFTEAEKGQLYVKFNMAALLRGDTKSRGQFYKDLFYIGAMSPNDIRELEDVNPRSGGDEYFTPVNMRIDAEITKKLEENGKS